MAVNIRFIILLLLASQAVPGMILILLSYLLLPLVENQLKNLLLITKIYFFHACYYKALVFRELGFQLSIKISKRTLKVQIYFMLLACFFSLYINIFYKSARFNAHDTRLIFLLFSLLLDFRIQVNGQQIELFYYSLLLDMLFQGGT